MPPSRQQLARIVNAIRDSFTPGALEQLVLLRLGERLANIAGGANQGEVVFHLVDWADRQGRLAELVQAAHEENPQNPELAALAEEFARTAPGPDPQAVANAPWWVPFERIAAFFGRTEDLQRLHDALGMRSTVGIRPAGVTGLGGIGKTQLAVEYAYLHRADYPGGVFWLNGAADWRAEFAALGVYLEPSLAGEAQEAQIRAAADYLRTHADSLLVLDNVDDPQQLRQPLTRFLVPSALHCRLLFTTRRHELGDFRPVELTVLAQEPGLQLLLRYPSRQTVLDADHPEHAGAVAIYHMLGGLPLALEIAGAHLRRRPGASLASYRQDLLRRGALDVVDDRRGGVRDADLGTRHPAAVAATLAEQWESLDEDARLLLRVGALLPEAAAIPAARLGLLSGLADTGDGFFDAPLAAAVEELVGTSLLEDLRGDLVRLHPLVREFGMQQTPAPERDGFRWYHAARLLVSYDDLAVLEEQCARRGIDAVEQDLLAGLDLLGDSPPTESVQSLASLLLRTVRQESHILRGWDAAHNPAFFRQQWLKRTLLLHDDERAGRARTLLNAKSGPHLEVTWTTAHSGMSLVRTLTGHAGWVYAVAVTPDGRQAVSGSGDNTLRVWDLTTGESMRTLTGHDGGVIAVTVTPDGRQAVSGSGDNTLRVWDLATRAEQARLVLDSDVPCVAVAVDGRTIFAGDSSGDLWCLRYWD